MLKMDPPLNNSRVRFEEFSLTPVSANCYRMQLRFVIVRAGISRKHDRSIGCTRAGKIYIQYAIVQYGRVGRTQLNLLPWPFHHTDASPAGGRAVPAASRNYPSLLPRDIDETKHPVVEEMRPIHADDQVSTGLDEAIRNQLAVGRRPGRDCSSIEELLAASRC